MNGTPHIVLVHGAWHTAWVWDRTRQALEKRGYRSSTVSLPSCGDPKAGLTDDISAVSRAVAAIEGPVVLCGHSYGGMAITGAELDARVKKLVYLCAFMPEAGKNVVSHFPALPPYVELRPDGTVAFVTSMARDVFYNDLSDEDAGAAIKRLTQHTAAAVTTPVPRASWVERPSLYIVCTKDHTIPVDVQRMFAARATETVDLATSHSPMLSAPEQLAELLAKHA